LLISIQKRFVFVANSKTASTSIENTLRPQAEIERGGTPRRKHIPMREVLKEYDFLFGNPAYAPDTFFRFGVMRDPLDWLQSWYRYRRGNKVRNPLPADMSFEEFWQKKDWNIQRKNGARNLQRRFFDGPNGNILVDYIIPYDDLARHFGLICAEMGLENPLQEKNVSHIRETESAFPEGLEAEIRDYYARDYALLEQLETLNTKGLEHLKETRSIL
jgi:hypothetical protein